MSELNDPRNYLGIAQVPEAVHVQADAIRIQQRRRASDSERSTVVSGGAPPGAPVFICYSLPEIADRHEAENAETKEEPWVEVGPQGKQWHEPEESCRPVRVEQRSRMADAAKLNACGRAAQFVMPSNAAAAIVRHTKSTATPRRIR